MIRAEVTRRLGSVDWLTSQATDAWLSVWHRAFARSEFAQIYRCVRPYTMSGPSRLHALYGAVRGVLERDVPGAVVECGTARGGSAALMGLALARARARRPLWVFDTFDGIPPPTDGDPDFHIARSYTGHFRGELAEVRALFDRLGIGEDVRLVKGLFQDTLPAADVGPIAVLHVDGDWYESVKVCLEQLYERVSPGGIVQIDDYGHWDGARRATDEFLAALGLDVELRYLDYTGRQFTRA